jgi:FlaG/FlaF family flagellin (archaellin)
LQISRRYPRANTRTSWKDRLQAEIDFIFVDPEKTSDELQRVRLVILNTDSTISEYLLGLQDGDSWKT